MRTTKSRRESGGAAELRDALTTAVADRIVAAATPSRVVGVVLGLRVPLIDERPANEPVAPHTERRGAKRRAALKK